MSHVALSKLDASPGRVLLVDDEPALLRAMSRVVVERGYDALLATNAHEAIAMLAAAPDVDVIISDVAMPGMSGIDLLRAVRSYDADVAVVLMTGLPSFHGAAEAV